MGESMDASCETCRVNCRSMHQELGLISCPLPGTCDICPEIADIDEQVSKTFRLLSDLGKQRQELVQKMNSRHDDLTRALPVEIVSRIFVLFRYSAPYDFGAFKALLSGPINLGSICRRWRDITLGTPELWTDVIIHTTRDVDHVDLVEEWLRRSGSLPLNVELRSNGACHNPPGGRYGPHGSFYYLKLDRLLPIVKSHSRRWHNLKLTGFSDFPAFPEVFDDLEGIPDINVLEIRPEYFSHPFDLRLRPKEYILNIDFWIETTLEWSNLTFLGVHIIPVECFLNIIRVAKQLRTCFVFSTESDPLLAITHTVHHSLKRLSADRDILLFLTLPSLQHLQYRLFDLEALETLDAFIRRSSPPLQSVFLSDIDSTICHLFKDLFTITQLRLEFRDEEPNQSPALEHFLGCMTNDSESHSRIPFPNLQSLEITAFTRMADYWSLLASLFPRPNHPPERWQTRPISFIAVSIKNHPSLLPSDRTADLEVLEMDKDTLMHLLQVRQSGVTLDFRVPGASDVLLHMSKIYHLSTERGQTSPLALCETLEETWRGVSRRL